MNTLSCQIESVQGNFYTIRTPLGVFRNVPSVVGSCLAGDTVTISFLNPSEHRNPSIIYKADSNIQFDSNRFFSVVSFAYKAGLWSQGQANPGLTMLGSSLQNPYDPTLLNIFGTHFSTGDSVGAAHTPLGIVSYMIDPGTIHVTWLYQKKLSSSTYQLTLEAWNLTGVILGTSSLPVWSLALGSTYVTPTNTSWSETPPNQFNMHKGLGWGHLFWDETNKILVVLGHGSVNLRKSIFVINHKGELKSSLMTPYLLHQSSYSNLIITKGWWSNTVDSWHTGNAFIPPPDPGREQAGVSIVSYSIKLPEYTISQSAIINPVALMQGSARGRLGFSSPSVDAQVWDAYYSIWGPEGRWPINPYKSHIVIWGGINELPDDDSFGRNIGELTCKRAREIVFTPALPGDPEVYPPDAIEVRNFGPTTQHAYKIAALDQKSLGQVWSTYHPHSPEVVEDTDSIAAWSSAISPTAPLSGGLWWGGYSSSFSGWPEPGNWPPTTGFLEPEFNGLQASVSGSDFGRQWLQVIQYPGTGGYVSTTTNYTGYASENSISYGPGSIKPALEYSGVSTAILTSGYEYYWDYSVYNFSDGTDPNTTGGGGIAASGSMFDFTWYHDQACHCVDNVTTTGPAYGAFFPGKPRLFPLPETYPPRSSRYSTSKKGYDLTAINIQNKSGSPPMGTYGQTEMHMRDPVGGVMSVDTAGVTWGACLLNYIIVEGQDALIPVAARTDEVSSTEWNCFMIYSTPQVGPPSIPGPGLETLPSSVVTLAEARTHLGLDADFPYISAVGSRTMKQYSITIDTKMHGKTINCGKTYLFSVTDKGVFFKKDISVYRAFRPSAPFSALTMSSSLTRAYLGQIYSVIPLPKIGVTIVIRDMVDAFYNVPENGPTYTALPAIPYVVAEIYKYSDMTLLSTVTIVPKTEGTYFGIYRRKYQNKDSDTSNTKLQGVANTANQIGVRGCLDLSGNPWIIIASRVTKMDVSPSQDRILYTRMVFSGTGVDKVNPVVTNWDLLNTSAGFFRSEYDSILFAGYSSSRFSDFYVSGIGFMAPTYPS